MLKISEKTDLGIFFLLTVAQGEGASVADVARRWQFVSSGYLEEVVAALRRAGLVVGKKGRGGGYMLARSAEEIRILDIVNAVDGPLALVETPMHKKMRNPSTSLGTTFEGWCVSRRLWGKLQHDVEETLRGITLQDLVGEGREFSGSSSVVIARSRATKQSMRSPRPLASR